MPDLLTAMQTALLTAYPAEAWLVRDFGRLVKVELPCGTHTLCQYLSPMQADAVVGCGGKLLAWRAEIEAAG